MDDRSSRTYGVRHVAMNVVACAAAPFVVSTTTHVAPLGSRELAAGERQRGALMPAKHKWLHHVHYGIVFQGERTCTREVLA